MMRTIYKISDEWKSKAASTVHVQFPKSQIAMMPFIPRRFTVVLCEATQEQLMMLHQLHHPAVVEVKQEPDKNDKK